MHVMSPLRNVRALLFDVFGTVVDWHGCIVNELEQKARGTPYEDENWGEFAVEWRSGYYRLTKQFVETGSGPATVDEMHRLLLDDMLRSSRWAHLSAIWDDSIRTELVLGWHRLLGWPDTVPGLSALKERTCIGTLSNGNIRLLIDMAKHANLPWDVVFSSQLFQSYKPDPKVYQGAARLLDLPPNQVALVAAHIYDCAAGKAAGLKAVYVRRPTEDQGQVVDATSIEQGMTDAIVDDFWGIVKLIDDARLAEK